MEAIDPSGNSVPFSGSNAVLLPITEDSSIGIDGPGTFRLEIQADRDVTYTVIVCQRAVPSGGNNNRIHRGINRNNPFINNNPSSPPSNANSPSNNAAVQQPAQGNASGNGGASASATPANADNLSPVSTPQGNVVNSVPTSGPLPNTGGAPLLWILPLIGLFVLAGLPLYRWARRRS